MRKKVMNMFGEMNYAVPNPGFEPGRDAAAPEGEAGVSIDELPVGTVLEVETSHHTYVVETLGKGQVFISGHPEYCPEPVLVDFHGSTDGTPLIKMWFIGRGMHMEFRHPTFGVVRTSRVKEIRERKNPIVRAA